MRWSVNNRQNKEEFTLSTPVEETKDLIAVHNLSQDDLMRAIRLGGFVMVCQ